MFTTTINRRRAAGIVSLLATTALVLISLAGGHANAAPKTQKLAGTFDFAVAPTPACPQPGCAKATFRGVVTGPGEGPTTAIFPAQPPTNLIGEGTLVVHTFRGNLNLAGTTVFNPDPASDGEITFHFKIVGGTGALTGASGYIIAAGVAQVPAQSATNVLYLGKLVLP